jgi:ferritin-like metal-binding protein YciE
VTPEKTAQRDLFIEKDIYFAERQILKTLPKLAKAANSEKATKSWKITRETRPSTLVCSPGGQAGPGGQAEMSRYGTSKTWATQLGMSGAFNSWSRRFRRRRRRMPFSASWRKRKSI